MAWKNVQYENGKYRTSEGGGGGGSSTFAGLDDVDFSNLQNGQVPKYNSTTQKWENADESGGGGNITDVQVDGVSVVNPQGVAEIETPNADAIEYDNQQSGLLATDVKSAIDELAQGGGGSITTLSNDAITSLNVPYNLADDITNYDLILVHAYYTGGSGYPLVVTQVFTPSQLIAHNRQTWLVGGNADRMISINFPTNTTIQMINSNGGNGLQGIYGIKLYGNSNTYRHDYSTTEQVIGTWIDGKPVYEIVKPITTTSENYNFDVSSLNIDFLVDLRIQIKNVNGGSYCNGTYWQATNDYFNYYLQSSKQIITFRSGSGYAYGTGHVILQYTKTTD